MDQRALPVPDDPDRPRGRHEAPRRSVGGPAGAAIAVVIVAVVVAGVLATWLISSAKEPPQPASANAATTQGGPTSRPGPAAFGNLVGNWSFEQDLGGWQVLGAADASREPQGRTSGSSASVRGPGAAPANRRQARPPVGAKATRGPPDVATAWVRSSASGQQVTLRVVGAGANEVSRKTVATLPGLEWRRVIVDHTAASAGPLRLEIVADGVPAGDTLLVDEVVVRLG